MKTKAESDSGEEEDEERTDVVVGDELNRGRIRSQLVYLQENIVMRGSRAQEERELNENEMQEK